MVLCCRVSDREVERMFVKRIAHISQRRQIRSIGLRTFVVSSLQF